MNDRSLGYKFNLPKFCLIKSKESGHFDDLIWTDEVRGIGTEFLDAGIELPTSHGLGNIQPEGARTICRVVQTKFADNHYCYGGTGRVERVCLPELRFDC